MMKPQLPHPAPESPLKVVHVASGDLWAGAEKQLFVLLKALRQQGVEVSAVVLNRGTLADRLTEAGIATQIFDEQRMNSLAIFRRLRAHLKRVQPDVIHTHRVKENILAGMAGASLGIPSVRTQHGAQEHPTSLLDFRRLILVSADFLAGRLLQRRVVAVSSVLEQTLASRFGTDKVVLIENGLDVDRPLPERHWGAKPVWSIGIVGRQVPVKRVDLFLHAAKRLEDLEPEQGFNFSVVGGGPLLEQHVLLAQQLGFSNPVEFTGHVENAEETIAKLDLLVICSDHEGLPMVALEAMRAGVVVVSHAIGALPDVLEHGSCGILASEHSPEGFSRALQSAVAMDTALVHLQQKAFARLCERYSAEIMAQGYASLYAAMVKPGGP